MTDDQKARFAAWVASQEPRQIRPMELIWMALAFALACALLLTNLERAAPQVPEASTSLASPLPAAAAPITALTECFNRPVTIKVGDEPAAICKPVKGKK